jgi:hypothetical protein
MRYFRFALLVLILWTYISAAAQTDSPPLLDMLLRVPAVPSNRGMLTFTDFAAIEAAYPPAERPEDWETYAAWDEAERPADDEPPINPPYTMWWSVFRRLSTGQSVRYFGLGGETPELVGFDLFEIDQELNYGTPPEASQLFRGDFDLDAIRSAYEARGYTQEAREGAELWCSEDGCEAGMNLNLAMRNPANPFGGELGRAQPLLIAGSALISSPSDDMIEEHIAVAQGERRSLGDTPEYQAAVNAMTTDGVLLQAAFLDGEMLLRYTTGSHALDLTSFELSEEERAALIEELMDGYETLPQFSLLAVGEVITETEQQARVILIYGSRENAERAAEVLPRRIETTRSLVTDQVLSEMLAARRVEDIRYEVIEHVNRAALVITFAGQKATPEELILFNQPGLSATPTVPPPGTLFNQFNRMIVAADLNWLSTVPRSELEALVESLSN